ncbi:MAG: hypothetical protein JZD41_07625 [Thermoproteus sp.]|nr:hypothetical protein [Thermoproteus sp.]
MPNSGTKPSKEGGAQGGRPATEARPQRSNVVYRGQYVVVRERNGFYNAYTVNNPEVAPADLVAHALGELIEKRDEIKVDGIIWLRGPGFRLGVPPDKRVIITPNFGRKAIILDNIVKFIRRVKLE